jgi:beta-glucosidase/6-phospho-beta-glucosidase/beta-galactosidase
MKYLLFLLLITSVVQAQTIFPESFFFGLATAPGQVEDQLDDIWKVWGETGKTRAFQNTPLAQERLRFWTQPEIELDLAAKTGIQVYRLGVDWGRVMPKPHVFDQEVLKRYHEILSAVKTRNMKIMLTLMHHSVPKWAQDMDGWHNDEMKNHFNEFAQKMIQEFDGDVEYWITFNEANVFATLAYTAGLWPPGEKSSMSSMLALGPIRGKTVEAMDRMSDSHNEIYKWAHEKFPKIKMGIAHNMAYYTGKSFIDRISARYTSHLMNWRFPSKIKGHMDFFGFNYYGAEWLKGTTVDTDPVEEYSEAGRAIYTQGLYLLLKEIHDDYKGLPIIITENGISDATDILRPAYLIEHLEAMAAAMKEGVPVIGYIFWTLSDNMEWSDGYCPKFGLVEVDRANNLKRNPRGSYNLFQQIVQTHQISVELRNDAWNKVVTNVGKERPYCRASDGLNALDKPVMRKIVSKDWRFSLPE